MEEQEAGKDRQKVEENQKERKKNREIWRD